MPYRADRSEKKPPKKKDSRVTRRLRTTQSRRNRRFQDPLDEVLPDSSGPVLTGEIVGKILARLGVSLSEAKKTLLLDHLRLVSEINKRINLVSRLNVEHVLLSSLWESLAAFHLLAENHLDNLLDLGTGGGFPGIPLAIALGNVPTTLLDSRRAKTLALKSIVESLSLENVRIVHDRAETLPEHEDERYSVVTARAVGRLSEVCAWSRPLLRNDGHLLVWKGPEGLREFHELPSETWKLHRRTAIFPHRSIFSLAAYE